MSYTLTLDMPQEAVRFTERKLDEAGADFSALFLAFLRTQFGYEESAGASSENGDVGALTRSLSGVVKLNEDVDDKDLFAKGVMEKYASIS